MDKVAELERRLSDETAWEEHEKMLTDAATAKIRDLQTQVEEKDAYWNDWLNSEFGDNLYPLDPPEPDEFVEKVKKLQTELDGFKSICNEYLSGPEASWQDLSNWCEEKTDEIVELKEEMGELESKTEDFEYDLQSLQSDLKQLDTLMDDLHGISEYDDVADMLTEIQSFLKVCDRNSDGHYEHYETRQIAVRFECGVYEKS